MWVAATFSTHQGTYRRSALGANVGEHRKPRMSTMLCAEEIFFQFFLPMRKCCVNDILEIVTEYDFYHHVLHPEMFPRLFSCLTYSFRDSRWFVAHFQIFSWTVSNYFSNFQKFSWNMKNERWANCVKFWISSWNVLDRLWSFRVTFHNV